MLQIRWQVFAAAKKWEGCLHISDALIQLTPERASGWVTKSIALHGLQRWQDAHDVLLPIVNRFPHVAAIPYDLACYACRLGDMEEAQRWLSLAFEVAAKAGEDKQIRLKALEDPDLEPLWKEIGSIES